MGFPGGTWPIQSDEQASSCGICDKSIVLGTGPAGHGRPEGVLGMDLIKRTMRI